MENEKTIQWYLPVWLHRQPAFGKLHRIHFLGDPEKLYMDSDYDVFRCSIEDRKLKTEYLYSLSEPPKMDLLNA